MIEWIKSALVGWHEHPSHRGLCACTSQIIHTCKPYVAHPGLLLQCNITCYTLPEPATPKPTPGPQSYELQLYRALAPQAPERASRVGLSAFKVSGEPEERASPKLPLPIRRHKRNLGPAECILEAPIQPHYYIIAYSSPAPPHAGIELESESSDDDVALAQHMCDPR